MASPAPAPTRETMRSSRLRFSAPSSSRPRTSLAFILASSRPTPLTFIRGSAPLHPRPRWPLASASASKAFVSAPPREHCPSSGSIIQAPSLTPTPSHGSTPDIPTALVPAEPHVSRPPTDVPRPHPLSRRPGPRSAPSPPRPCSSPPQAANFGSSYRFMAIPTSSINTPDFWCPPPDSLFSSMHVSYVAMHGSLGFLLSMELYKWLQASSPVPALAPTRQPSQQSTTP